MPSLLHVPPFAEVQQPPPGTLMQSAAGATQALPPGQVFGQWTMTFLVAFGVSVQRS